MKQHSKWIALAVLLVLVIAAAFMGQTAVALYSGIVLIVLAGAAVLTT